MPVPFSKTFIDPFVVGVLFGMKLELVEATVLLSTLVLAKKLKGDGAFEVAVLKPVNEPNALFFKS
jgi:hypothetical protein